MKTIKLLFLNTLACLIISSLTTCVGDVHCPAFPAEMKIFYPYEKGDTLRFVNAANDTLELVIKELQITEAYTFPKNCDCDCNAAILEFATSADKYLTLNISGSIKSFNYKDWSIKCSVIQEYRYDYEYFPYTFSMDMNTITLKDDNNFDSVVVKKGVGIESFYDKENDCTWVKI